MRKHVAALIFGVAALIVLSPNDAHATGGEGEAWPAFTESSSCGAQRVSTPLADEQGWLSTSDLLRGEFAGMFGRTVGDVFSHLVRWEIPGSFDTFSIHERALPAFELARTDLEAAMLAGERYPIRAQTTYSTAARTIAGNWRISRHTFGTAVDVNAHANPHRGDNKLITNMPDWWVDAFLDAGFCWGGLWIGSKDTMHYAWQGPAFSGYETLPKPYEPLTEPRPLVLPSRRVPIVPQGPTDPLTTTLSDADTNGAIDVVRVAETDDGLVIDASLASLGHTACSSRRSLVAGLGELASRAHTIGFGDWDGRGGQDLWLVTEEEGKVRLTVRWAFGDFTAETSVVTGVPMPSEQAWISTADYDADGALDLYIVDGDRLTVWAVDSYTGATNQQLAITNPMPSSATLFLGDADLDTRPDLWGLYAGTVEIAAADDGYAKVSTVHHPLGLPAQIVDAVAADYDGDGRTDMIVFDGTTKIVWLANTRLPDGLPLEVWFQYPDAECEDRLPSSNLEDLQFTSNGWIATGSYEWRRANGFTAGCDPEKEGCIPPIVTATSLAEFFAWIHGLEPASGDPERAAARAVARAGFSLPCSTHDAACWAQPLLRTEVAYYFGRFLADRRGDVPTPHRWVLPESIRIDLDPEPH